MDKKIKKNLIQQRLDFFLEQKVDLYNQLFREEEVDVDVIKALRLTLDDKNEITLKPYKASDSVSQKSKVSEVEVICQFIDKYLKPTFISDSIDLIRKKELKQLIIDGQICEENLSWVMFELSGARTLLKQNPGVFQDLLKMKHKYPIGYFSSIQMDVVRTIVENNPLQKILKQQRIQNVLEAYAIRNPFVGYCQGQNFIVDSILHSFFFEEELAFWIYVAIVEIIMPLDYYTSVISALIDQKIMEHYLEIFIPQLTAHFKQIGLECNFFTINWFICLFTQTLHPQILREVFLRLFVSGIRTLIITAITILFIHLDDLLKIHDFSDVSIFLNNRVSEFQDLDHFRFIYNQFNLRKKPFHFAREQLRYDSLSKQNIKLSTRNISEIQNIPQCNLESPICLKVIETNKLLRRTFSFFVFQQEHPIEIIHDYLDFGGQNDRAEQQKKEVIQGNVLVGMQYHVCQSPYDIEEESKIQYRCQAFIENYDDKNDCINQYSKIQTNINPTS